MHRGTFSAASKFSDPHTDKSLIFNKIHITHHNSKMDKDGPNEAAEWKVCIHLCCDAI